MGHMLMNIFRPLILIALAVVSLSVIAGCGDEGGSGTGTATGATGDTGGRIQITETYYDFGRVPIDTTVEHTFEIKNSGTGPLYLQQPIVKLLEGC